MNAPRLILAAALLLAAARSQAATSPAAVQWTFHEQDGTPAAGRKVYITPLSAPNIDGANIGTLDRQTYTTDAAGSLIVSNLITPASYRVELAGRFITTAITNTFPLTNGLIAAAGFTSTSPGSPDAAAAWTIAQSDARYLQPTNSQINTGTLYADNINLGAGALSLGLRPLFFDASQAYAGGAGDIRFLPEGAGQDRLIVDQYGAQAAGRFLVTNDNGGGNSILLDGDTGRIYVNGAQLSGGASGSTSTTITPLAPYAGSSYAIDFSAPTLRINTAGNFILDHSINGSAATVTNLITYVFIPPTNTSRVITLANAATNWQTAGMMPPAVPTVIPANAGATIRAVSYGPGETNTTIRLIVHGFSPRDIPGLLLWLDAAQGVYQVENGTTPCTDNTTIKYWQDLSGNNLSVTNATSQNVWRAAQAANGLPWVSFNAVSQAATQMKTRGFYTRMVYGAVTIFFVFNNRMSANQYLCDSINGELALGQASSWIMYNGTTSTGPSAGPPANKISDIAAVFNRGYSQVYTNGVFFWGGDCGSQESQGLVIGCNGTTFPAAADLQEVIAYSGALSAQQITAVDAYLNKKFGPFPR